MSVIAITIVSAASYNRPEIMRGTDGEPEAVCKDERVRQQVDDKLGRAVMAATTYCDVMVMTAIGRGAFGHPPNEVAALARSRIESSGSGAWVGHRHQGGLELPA